MKATTIGLLLVALFGCGQKQAATDAKSTLESRVNSLESNLVSTDSLQPVNEALANHAEEEQVWTNVNRLLTNSNPVKQQVDAYKDLHGSR